MYKHNTREKNPIDTSNMLLSDQLLLLTDNNSACYIGVYRVIQNYIHVNTENRFYKQIVEGSFSSVYLFILIIA